MSKDSIITMDCGCEYTNYCLEPVKACNAHKFVVCSKCDNKKAQVFTSGVFCLKCFTLK